MRTLPTSGKHKKCYREHCTQPLRTHVCDQVFAYKNICKHTHIHKHTHAHTHTHTNTHKNTHTHTHTQARTTWTHMQRERCTFNLTSLLGHTSAEPKKLGTGMHAPEDGICHNILTKSRQHPLQSTYIVLFLNIAATPKKKTCYLGIALHHCS